MTQVTIFSKPACVQCVATMRALSEHEIDFEVVDMSANEDALERVRVLGYQQAPVVFAGGLHWSGFRPGRIAALADGWPDEGEVAA